MLRNHETICSSALVWGKKNSLDCHFKKWRIQRGTISSVVIGYEQRCLFSFIIKSSHKLNYIYINKWFIPCLSHLFGLTGRPHGFGEARPVTRSDWGMSRTQVLRHTWDRRCVFQQRSRNLDLVSEKLEKSFRTFRHKFTSNNLVIMSKMTKQTAEIKHLDLEREILLICRWESSAELMRKPTPSDPSPTPVFRLFEILLLTPLI